MMGAKQIQALFATAFLWAATVNGAHAQQAPAPAQQAPVAGAHAGPAVGGERYILGPGDKVHVTVFGEQSMTGDYSVSAAGNISFPLIGSVTASNRTMEDVGDEIRARLAEGYINDPRVAIELEEYRTFFILGEVNKPGAYPYTAGLTLAQAIATAGGYTYRAKKSKIVIKHMDEVGDQKLSLKEAGSVAIRPGDTITIPERFF